MFQGDDMPKYQEIEAELQKMRETKDAIERQLAELQQRIDRTERAVKSEKPEIWA